MDVTTSVFSFIFFFCFVRLFSCTFLLCSLFSHRSVAKTRNNTRVSKTILVHLLQIFYYNFNRLFLKFRDLKRKNSQHKSCRSSFYISFRYMDPLFWINKVEIVTLKYRLVRNFRITNRFISKNR
jgi:hypothetical protein